ncbi:MAG: amino acid adenylation domain-containing protein, partial [Prevotellaceae bacterium]|nr:amino acid adenylation domain-containing protein [Prevotellaceae bacterium]
MQRTPLYKRFEDIAKQTPDSVALECGSCRVNSADLNEKANRLAGYLVAHGVGKGCAVGLYLTHNQDIPLAVLAVQKAGGCYVPLSTAFPAEKIRDIISDAACSVVVANAPLPFAKDGVTVVDLAAQSDLLQQQSAENPEVSVAEGDAAYILYTSGTTGKPKGVVISHGNLTYYVDWYLSHLHGDTGGDLPLMSSLAFAAAVKQLYVPLSTGACLHILPPHVAQNSSLLFDWYSRHPSHGMYIVPTLWEEHLRYAKANGVTALPRFILFSGEPLKEKLVSETFAHCGNIRLWNLYGPTETVANITYARVEKGAPITIGRALESSEVLLVDDDLRPVAGADVGELCAAGPGVTSGYLHRGELNLRQFFTLNGKRYYRTGDCAAYLPDGTLKCLGRKDRQVKISGIRVELGEVENALSSLPNVRESVVLVDRSEDYDHKLAAYVLSDHEKPYAAYVDGLKKILPEYAIPASIVTLQAFPKLPNGKIDVLHLPAAKNQQAKPTAGEGTAARISAMLAALTNGANLAPEDNILYSGASSITIIKLANRIQSAFHVHLLISDIYSHPDIRSLANFVDTQAAHLTQAEERPTIGEDLPLAVNQKTLWLVEKTKEVKQAYNIVFSINIKDEKFSPARLQNALNTITQQNDVLRSLIVPDGHSGNPVRKVLSAYQP